MILARNRQTFLIHELLFPVLLFGALGGFGWAIRGTSGYGAWQGCLFAGVLWAAAWHFLAREPRTRRSRRYGSGWVVLAMTLGVGFAGNRGWMQWRTWFDGQIYTNWAAQEWHPIHPIHGWIWLFVAGIPWAGMGAIALAWCGSKRPLRLKDWAIRIGIGVAAALISKEIFKAFPNVFLPLYDQIDYKDLTTNPTLKRVINDNGQAVVYLAMYLAFLGYEALRKDWNNVKLISIVGLANGVGWACLQNWQWSWDFWKEYKWGFWRCWETTSGISIGISYGLAWFFCNRPTASKKEEDLMGPYPPYWERLAVIAGLIIGVAFSIRSALVGWVIIYVGQEAEDKWDPIFTAIVLPLAALLFIALWLRQRKHPYPPGFSGDSFPAYTKVYWTVLLVQNILGQVVTGPISNWIETAYKLYYLLLFILVAVIVLHYSVIRRDSAPDRLSPSRERP